MTAAPCITVAPNGARFQRSDHTDLRVSPQELADTARALRAADAQSIHLHMRASGGAHRLKVGLNKATSAAIHSAAPGMNIQVTTGSGGRNTRDDRLDLLEALKPAVASISVCESACTADLAPQIYRTATQNSTTVQHILYGTACYIDRLATWLACGLVLAAMRDAFLFLGKYVPARARTPTELAAWLDLADPLERNMSIGAFDPDEKACLQEAPRRKCDLRVGFENNIYAPNGSI